jgi:hypothetical protein
MTGKDIHVALTFDYDAYSVWIGTFAAKSPSMISRGEFGPQGVRRILQLLGQYRIRGTFFVPGHTALAFPRTVVDIAAAGHEIGHHGWIHENPANTTPDQERWIMGTSDSRRSIRWRASDRSATARQRGTIALKPFRSCSNTASPTE